MPTGMHVIAVGPFGVEVAHRLAQACGDVVVTQDPPALNSSAWPMAGLHVLAAWRPVPAFADILDELAYNWRVPWLPVILEHPNLQVGPLVVPGASACHACYQRRMLQHSTKAETIQALYHHYDSDASAGPAGYLPSHAGVASAMVRGVAERLRTTPTEEAGVVRRFNLINMVMAKGTVVGVHGCQRCGLKRDEESRSSAQLLSDLRLLVPGPGSAVGGHGP